MNSHNDRLTRRIRELEKTEYEYYKIKQLLSYAADGGDLDRLAGDMILYVDPQTGVILKANPLASEILGYTPTQLQGLRVEDLEVFPAQLESEMQHYVETSIEKDVYECYYRQADGHLLHVRVQKRVIEEGDGAMSHYALEDLSLQRLLWKELRRREDTDFQFREHLKRLNEINTELGVLNTFDEVCYHAIRLGTQRLGFERLSIWFLDAETNRMVGTYGTDENGNIRDEHLSSWSFENTYLEDFLRGQRAPVITQDQAPIYNNQSQIIGYGWHISVPLYYQGQFIGYMTSDNYLSKQPMKTYQPELLRLYGSTIGHFAAHQRDRELARKLETDISLKQARVKLLETFINQVGHDFRTPLTVINTNAYLLNKSKDESRRVELARNIQGQVMYINRVIKQTLEMVKLESGLTFDCQSVEGDMFIRKIAAELEPQAQDKEIAWTVQTTHPFTMRVDVDWMGTALRELLTNAIQYTPKGGQIRVGVSVETQEISIRVQDTGIGIAPQEINKIFNHLYRVDQARTERGVGLGLTMAKVIVEAHGGQIRVESELGVGSLFEILLPR